MAGTLDRAVSPKKEKACPPWYFAHWWGGGWWWSWGTKAELCSSPRCIFQSWCYLAIYARYGLVCNIIVHARLRGWHQFFCFVRYGEWRCIVRWCWWYREYFGCLPLATCVRNPQLARRVGRSICLVSFWISLSRAPVLIVIILVYV